MSGAGGGGGNTPPAAAYSSADDIHPDEQQGPAPPGGLQASSIAGLVGVGLRTLRDRKNRSQQPLLKHKGVSSQATVRDEADESSGHQRLMDVSAAAATTAVPPGSGRSNNNNKLMTESSPSSDLHKLIEATASELKRHGELR